jgi:sec-independent protein translocase protein TatB
MFDVGFWEIMFIMVVALLVVGPERLPRLARTAGMWLGKAQRFVRTVKIDIDRELAAEELKSTLAKQAEMPELHEIIEETKQTIHAADPTQISESLSQTANRNDASTKSTDKTSDGPSHDANG